MTFCFVGVDLAVYLIVIFPPAVVKVCPERRQVGIRTRNLSSRKNPPSYAKFLTLVMHAAISLTHQRYAVVVGTVSTLLMYNIG